MFVTESFNEFKQNLYKYLITKKIQPQLADNEQICSDLVSALMQPVLSDGECFFTKLQQASMNSQNSLYRILFESIKTTKELNVVKSWMVNSRKNIIRLLTTYTLVNPNQIKLHFSAFIKTIITCSSVIIEQEQNNEHIEQLFALLQSILIVVSNIKNKDSYKENSEADICKLNYDNLCERAVLTDDDNVNEFDDSNDVTELFVSVNIMTLLYQLKLAKVKSINYNEYDFYNMFIDRIKNFRSQDTGVKCFLLKSLLQYNISVPYVFEEPNTLSYINESLSLIYSDDDVAISSLRTICNNALNQSASEFIIISKLQHIISPQGNIRRVFQRMFKHKQPHEGDNIILQLLLSICNTDQSSSSLDLNSSTPQLIQKALAIIMAMIMLSQEDMVTSIVELTRQYVTVYVNSIDDIKLNEFIDQLTYGVSATLYQIGTIVNTISVLMSCKQNDKNTDYLGDQSIKKTITDTVSSIDEPAKYNTLRDAETFLTVKRKSKLQIVECSYFREYFDKLLSAYAQQFIEQRDPNSFQDTIVTINEHLRPVIHCLQRDNNSNTITAVKVQYLALLCTKDICMITHVVSNNQINILEIIKLASFATVLLRSETLLIHLLLKQLVKHERNFEKIIKILFYVSTINYIPSLYAHNFTKLQSSDIQQVSNVLPTIFENFNKQSQRLTNDEYNKQHIKQYFSNYYHKIIGLVHNEKIVTAAVNFCKFNNLTLSNDSSLISAICSYKLDTISNHLNFIKNSLNYSFNNKLQTLNEKNNRLMSYVNGKDAKTLKNFTRSTRQVCNFCRGNLLKQHNNLTTPNHQLSTIIMFSCEHVFHYECYQLCQLNYEPSISVQEALLTQMLKQHQSQTHKLNEPIDYNTSKLDETCLVCRLT